MALGLGSGVRNQCEPGRQGGVPRAAYHGQAAGQAAVALTGPYTATRLGSGLEVETKKPVKFRSGRAPVIGRSKVESQSFFHRQKSSIRDARSQEVARCPTLPPILF